MTQKIDNPPNDLIRQKFDEMHSMDTDKLYDREDTNLFYKQAKFMEDFTDSYEKYDEWRSIYGNSSCYQDMDYTRLRSYFTWRTKVRKGEIKPISKAFILLHMNELLMCIGAKTPVDALNRLLFLWKAWRMDEVFEKKQWERYSWNYDNVPELDKWVLNWIKSFHIYYDLPHSFEEFVDKHRLHSHYYKMYLFDYDNNDCVEVWNRLANKSYSPYGYDIITSKFYNADPKNADLVKKCFCEVIRTIDKYFVRNSVEFKELIAIIKDSTEQWYPFKYSNFHPWLDCSDRIVELPGGKKYVCNDNIWTTNYIDLQSHSQELALFFMRKTESVVNKILTGNKRIIGKSTMGNAQKYLMNMGIIPQSVNNVVENTIIKFYNEMNRVVVNVDSKNLERIREESEDTAEKLIVPELEKNDNLFFWEQPTQTLAESSLEPISDSAKDSPWVILKKSLSETERQALALILQNSADIKTFSDSQGIMLEVLADGINEKSMDIVGDNILSDTLEIYDEYRSELL